MTLGQAAIAFAALIVFICCMVMVFHHDYDSGFFGGLALGAIAFAALSRFAHLMAGTGAPAAAPAYLIWFGLAVFMARTVLRFLVRRRGRTWYPGDHVSAKRKSAGAA